MACAIVQWYGIWPNRYLLPTTALSTLVFDLAEIINGYAQGYFLMADETDHLEWYRSQARTLIPLDDRFRYPKSLRRVLNQQRFETAISRDFDAVVEGCSDREETWISDELKAIYHALHDAGWAHSFETWQGDQLAGGILGLTIRGAFIGESMFSASRTGRRSPWSS